MELRHLTYFLAVASELNFTKAAEKLFISQPPLSRQIKELEEELGLKLFDRNNKKVSLTDAGKYFEKEIKELFLNLERIQLKTQKIAQNKSGDFCIGYTSSTFSYVISKLIQHLSALYPYVAFKLFEVSTLKQIADLEQGKLDLGILRAPLVSTKLHSKLWFEDTYSLVYNKQKLDINSEDEISQLVNEVFVFFNKDYAPYYYNSLLEICSSFGFIPNVVHESNSIVSIIQLIKNGLGVSIVPSSLSKSYASDSIGFIELTKVNLTTEVLLVSPKEAHSEITTSAIDFLFKV